MLIGNKVQILSTCHSTNDYLKEKMRGKIPNGEVVCALAQDNGRGQRGNTWESEPNKNLTFSFYLEPDNITVNEQFSINYFVSLGVYYFLERFLPDPKLLKLKWPNDIYYDKKKICGILIENHVKNGEVSNCVVGIGVNINQTKFENLNAASVLLLSGEDYDIQECLGFVLNSLNKQYQKFLQAKDELKSDYLSKLLGFEQERVFRDNLLVEDFIGRIVNVENSGALVLETSNEQKKYGLKEISFYF